MPSPIPVTAGLRVFLHAGLLTPVADGAAVATMPDLSGNGFTATVDYGTYKTNAFPNGAPAVRIPSPTGVFRGDMAGWGTGAGCTVLMAVANITPTQYARLFATTDYSSGNDYQSGISFYQAMTALNRTEVFVSTPAGAMYDGSFCATCPAGPGPVVFGLGYDSTTVAIFDGLGLSRRVENVMSVAPGEHLVYYFLNGREGWNPNAHGVGGDLGIAVMYNRLLTAAESRAVCVWMAREVGIIPALPGVSLSNRGGR